MSDYAFSFDGSTYDGSFNSRQDALEEAKKEIPLKRGLYFDEHASKVTVYTGQGHQISLNYKSLAESVIGDAWEQAQENDPDDYSDEWLEGQDTTDLQKAIKKWFDDNHLEIPYFLIGEVQEHEIEVEKNGK